MSLIHPGTRPVKARPARALVLALAACLALYAVDVACLATIPTGAHAYAANVAAPFDLMVCVPLAFYLLVLRPRRITPAAVLPVVYLGAGASAAIAQSGSFSLLTVLLPATLALDVAILGREGLRFVRAFRTARRTSTRPLDWFFTPFFELTRNEQASRMCALECSIWYYVLASWRARPDVPEGCRAFSYHRQSGYLALSGVIMALLPVETFVVHLLVVQWSPAAAIVLTVLSVYTLIWFAGNTRAVVLNPILVDTEAVTVRWGAYFSERVPLAAIERIQSDEPNLPKRERKDMGAMGSQPCWIVLKEPIAMRGIFGKPRPVRAINVTPDEATAFKQLVLDRR